MTARDILLKKARDYRTGKIKFELTKYGRQWAILDVVTRVYYFGKKRDLEKRLIELNFLESRGEL